MLTQIVPIPQADVSVREATLDDVAFIDSLQKIHRKQIGFMHDATLREKIAAREVLIAEDAGGAAVGYCIGTDRYNKHDDVGIIYHLNVVPAKQRGFVGGTLLKAMFERAAYGCKLFCAWTAQDIEANRFWENMGFVPLAFRAGSSRKGKGGRVHIFWQKRIRAGDTTTPWWFPSKTGAGAMREDRLVLPIPPGKHWSDELPVLRPEATAAKTARALPDKTKGTLVPGSKCGPQKPTPKPGARTRVQFGVPGATPPAVAPSVPPGPVTKTREKKPKIKADPKLVAAARELRDRWLEHVNSGALVIESSGKYDLSRALLPPAAGRSMIPALPGPGVSEAA